MYHRDFKIVISVLTYDIIHNYAKVTFYYMSIKLLITNVHIYNHYIMNELYLDSPLKCNAIIYYSIKILIITH